MYCLYFEICNDAKEVETEDVLMRLVTSVDTAAYFENSRLTKTKCKQMLSRGQQVHRLFACTY